MQYLQRRVQAAALVLLGTLACSGKFSTDGHEQPPLPPFAGKIGPILFVTQVPIAGFSTATSPFGNHAGSIEAAPRGGDLMLRNPDGTLRNLTREAGFGMTGMQGDKAIAVREPCVHWDGQKAVFSMVEGAPKAFEQNQYRWQLYEVTGFSAGETASITKVANQPVDYNNVSPVYASDDRIIFVSDRPRNGEAYLYPQLDEYESAASNTGLWRLDPGSGELRLLNHAPSGSFSPFIDSFGRIVFTKWDHLQRDQQADADRVTPGRYGAFTYADESETAARSDVLDGAEVFPEARSEADPTADPNVSAHRFNQFLPWELNQDGTAEETLNHIGRHEMGGTYLEGSFKDDPDLVAEISLSTHKNRYEMGGDGGMFHIREDAKNPGLYYAVNAHEFGTATGGALIKFVGGPSVNPDELEILAVTTRASALLPDDPAQAGDSTGHYRNPLPTTDGVLVAVHTNDTGPTKNLGSRANPQLNYEYRLVAMTQVGELWQAGAALTSGIEADISWYDPDVLVTYKGLLWELDPVEVVARPRPTARVSSIDAPEMAVYTELGVDLGKLRAWLVENDLALINMRNVTARDRADRQQPYNLRVPNGTSTVGAPDGKVYDVAYFQVFQGDALRGYGGVDAPERGRRLLARPMHASGLPAPPAGGPPGSVAIGGDGSVAAFVPARRALTWQLVSPTGVPVVRERNWVSFQPGEIRTCPVCHGVNTQDQLGRTVATNTPEALRTLLQTWLAANP
jgi:Hydrazine synthase alpha subunit middle domain